MTTSTAPMTYELRLAGHLDDHWSAILGGLTLARRDDGTTTLSGPVVDQAQLHGILTRVRDLGAPLLSLRTVEAVEGAAEAATPRPPGRPAPSQYAPSDSRSAPHVPTTPTRPGSTAGPSPSASG